MEYVIVGHIGLVCNSVPRCTLKLAKRFFFFFLDIITCANTYGTGERLKQRK